MSEKPTGSLLRGGFGFAPRRSGILLVLAVLIVLSFVFLILPMLRDRAPGDFETKKGDILLSSRSYEAAIERFSAALLVSPGHRGAMMGHAIALMESGRNAEAEAEFGRLIQRLSELGSSNDSTGQGTMAAAYANRGILRDRQGRYVEALADYRMALRIDRGAIEGPGLIDRVLYGIPRASSVAKRASYLERQLALPAEQRLLRVPELDARQRMHKP